MRAFMTTVDKARKHITNSSSNKNNSNSNSNSNNSNNSNNIIISIISTNRYRNTSSFKHPQH